ncbi:MAG TPA: hypothetical protein VGE78_04160, partial [Agromyces sp.]
MRKQVLAVVGVVAIAAGLVWWFGLRSPSRSTAPAARTEAKPTSAARGSDGVRTEGGDGDRAPMAALVDDDPKGSLRLEGQVVDAEEHPVSGATVIVSSNPPRTATTEADGGF